MKLQHLFHQSTPTSPLTSRFVITDGDSELLNTGSSTRVAQWLRKNGMQIPGEMTGPDCFSSQWTADLEKSDTILPPHDSKGERWYQDERLNELARINGGRLFGETTMLDMLESGDLLDHWDVPDSFIFGPDRSEK